MEKKYKITFAPVQGHTDFIYRKVHAQHFSGIDTYYTPFLRMPQRNKDKKDIAPEHNNMDQVVPQIMGGNVTEMTSLLQQIQDLGYRRVDYNYGCPFRLVVNKGRGSGSFKDLEKMLNSLEVPTDLKVSLKLRLGWDDPSQLLSILPSINERSFESVAVHARLGVQGYEGDVNREAFEQIYEQCKHPLFYNGDVKTIEDIEEICAAYPDLAGIMIGRGLLADPALADKWNSPEKYTDPEVLATAYESFHRKIVEEYSHYLEGGQHQIIQKIKTLWEYFLPETDKRVLKKIKKCRRMSDYQQILRGVEWK